MVLGVSYEVAFLIISLSVLPAWLLLILMPRSRLTRAFVHSGVYPVTFGMFYLIVIGDAMFFTRGNEGASGLSLEGVQNIFTHPLGVLAGWTHYLVFDLFVGAWISRDAIRRETPYLYVIPSLILTYVMGPLGLLSYFFLRVVRSRSFSMSDEVEGPLPLAAGVPSKAG